MNKSSRAHKPKSQPDAVVARPARFERLQSRMRGLLSRRPHRSLRLTRRRDYVRPLSLPGYWSFTSGVRQTLWQHKRLFIWAAAVYTLFTVLLVGMGSQEAYTQVSASLRDAGNEIFEGNWGELGQASLLLVSSATGAITAAPSDVQQVYATLLTLLLWLTTVWLLRAVLAGGRPRFRDGLYAAGSPIIATALVALLLIVQLLPVALAAFGYAAASETGLIDGGVEAMVFWIAALLLTVLSLYWITSTLIALVVVTLPGMYPMQAIRTAGDMVIGRRLRILLRLLWLGLTVAVTWIVTAIPIIILDAWLKGVLPVLAWLPIVPMALVALGTVTVVWSASYVYLLYRKVVDDDAAPA